MTARRRGLFWLGMGLVSVGLALLGYVAWEFWGTGWVSHRHRAVAMGEIHRAWAEPQTRSEEVKTRFGKAGAIVEIPAFGRHYAVPVLEGTDSDILAVGYGHFTGTAGPGRIGNYVLAAHRVTHGEPLRRMPELKAGDVVRILTRQRTYTYRLISGGADLIVPMTASWVTTPVPHNPSGGIEPPQRTGQRLITLTTCAELFHTDNRMIAFGVLERTDPTERAARPAPAERTAPTARS
jgi:sortase A